MPAFATDFTSVQVLGGRDFSTAIPRFALMWVADQSIMRGCKGEVFEY
jgi:hypothetical protein